MKNELRKQAVEIRKTLNTNAVSDCIINKLFELAEYKKSQNILCYYPLKYEISTIRCLEDKSKNIFLPRVNGLKLDICPFHKDKLYTGSFNIEEPQTEPINNTDIIDMIIIPAIAADKQGYRIGYGKGYYDRFLKENCKSSIKVILCFSQLLFDTVHPEIYDVKADIIVTEKDILHIKTLST